MTKKTFAKPITIKAVGVTFEERQGKLWNIVKTLKSNPEAKITTILRREPNNIHDPNAIAILAQITNGATAKIGYVPANKAIWMARNMDAGLIVRANKGEITYKPGAKTLGFKCNICYELAPKTTVPVQTVAVPAMA